MKTGYNSNGSYAPFLYPRYKMMLWPIDAATGKETAPVTVATHDIVGAELKPVFNAKFPLPDGLYILQILPFTLADVPIAPAAGECYPRIPFWVDKGGTAKNFPWFAQAYGDYEWTHSALGPTAGMTPLHFYCIKPASAHKAQAYPLPLDTDPYLPIPTGEKKSLTRVNLTLAQQQGLNWYPCTTDRGIRVTDGEHGYYPVGYTCFQPFKPYIDGPRGVAQTAYTLWLGEGRNNKVYFNTPHSWRRLDADGKVRTTIGIVHTYAPYHEDVTKYSAMKIPQFHPAVKIMGNWINIPLSEQYPKLSYFSFFDDLTTQPDPNAAPVQDATMAFPEQPHLETTFRGPVQYGGDAHDGGWVLAAEFDKADHLIPANVTRHFRVPDIFGGAKKDGIGFFASRSGNAIQMWDYRSRPAKFLGNLCAAPAGLLGGIIDGRNRYFPTLNGVVLTQAQARAYTVGPNAFIPGPEGISIVGNTLFVGSSSCGQVLSIDLTTKVITPACPVSIYNGQTFAVIPSVDALGRIFTVTFDNQTNGHAVAHVPGVGVGKDGVTYSHNAVWDWIDISYDASEGVGGATLDGVYPMSVYASVDRIIEGGSEENIRFWRMPRPGEAAAPDYAKLKAGHAEWNAAGYDVYGRLGYQASELPWGVSSNIDYWLQQQGHKP
jgi:hypothetical protein